MAKNVVICARQWNTDRHASTLPAEEVFRGKQTLNVQLVGNKSDQEHPPRTVLESEFFYPFYPFCSFSILFIGQVLLPRLLSADGRDEVRILDLIFVPTSNPCGIIEDRSNDSYQLSLKYNA